MTPRDLECLLCDETSDPTALPLSLLQEITNNFSADQEIGRGAFAVVYKGRLENKTVAVKKMSIPHEYEKEFGRELECLMMAKNNNVVRFLGYCVDTQGLMASYGGKFVLADVPQRLLCFEYLPKGSLHEYIHDTTRKPRWRDCYQIIMGICHGLHYLHQKNIVHLDLKPANILLDDYLVAKIADFGLSRCFHCEAQSQVITRIGGTYGYVAPECFSGKTQVTYRHSYGRDIYSLGVIIMEILTKEKYQTIDNVVAIWRNILVNSRRDEELELVRVCAEIGTKCTDVDPEKRPNTQDIINRLDEARNALNEPHQGMPNSPGETSSKENARALIVAETNTGNSIWENTANLDKLSSLETLSGFRVSNEQGCELKQLRDLNNLRGSLAIRGLQNVKSKGQALQANLAAKRLTDLKLWWGSNDDTGCNPEVEAEVLEGLCPPRGLQILELHYFVGCRYPDWMVGKNSRGPKYLQKLRLWRSRQLVYASGLAEAFPHLRVLQILYCSWDALPGNMEHLTALKKLEILSCKNIWSLPSLPQFLEMFTVGDCSDELGNSCQTVGHANWQKIKHIPTKYFW